MVVEEVLGATPEVVIELGRIGKWIQAVGLLVILWIIVQAITMFFNRKRRKSLYSIKADLKRIEKKIDRLDKKIKR
ncbi:MAG: hypothetical protein IIA87_00800 [Nanoarchaeota archaeon]|nr:hypothetical protein [Nanoarchaeota archaeon]